MADHNTIVFGGGRIDTTSPGLGANECLLRSGVQSVYQVCQPTKFKAKVISGEFTKTPFVGAGGVVPLYSSRIQEGLDPAPFLSGGRTGITFEGPFLRYTIAKGALGQVDMRGTYNNGAIEYWFDLVSDRVIFLPWMGQLEIVCQYPGRWEIETFALPDYGVRPDPRSSHPRMSQAPNGKASPLDSDMTLSLRVASSGVGIHSTRTLKGIPPGVHSFTVNTNTMTAGAFPIATIFQESAPSRGMVGPGGVPVNTVVDLALYGGVTSAFMNRVGWHNGHGLTVDSGANDSEGLVQMHIGFT